jgi:cytochrome c oxidase assembly factor CtaG/polyferredoxin
MIVVCLVIAAVFYFRGWRRLSHEMPSRFGRGRLVSFLLAETVLLAAFDSPLDDYAARFLAAHMAQHLLLLVGIPPLFWLSQPFLPILRGLPEGFRRDGLGPFLTAPELQRAAAAITHPLVCWFAGTGAMVFWHLPRFFELGLSSVAWHRAEHLSFLLGALLFWWPVMEVWPSNRRISWLMIPYLVLGDLVNSAISAYLVFSSQVVYTSYSRNPLSDQVTAGALMWVPGSVVYLVTAGFVTVRLLSPCQGQAKACPTKHSMGYGLAGGTGFSLSVFRSQSFRSGIRVVMLALAAAVIWDGFRGPQIASLNLAGVLPWNYWRGFSMIALLFAGNLFCFGCPFTLPRDLVRRFVSPKFKWPARLRTKWVAFVLMAVFFWAYEAFRLWNSPWWTAWIIMAYFLTATIIDTVFEGASFCKYVCPIGQFHFINSLVSPLQITTKSSKPCEKCSTHDCLHSCGLQLFQPTKQSNFDCTFCMRCVSACPSSNVEVAFKPLPQALKPKQDISAIALLVVLGAFVSAAAMTGPVETWIRGSLLRITLLFLAGFIAIPFIARARTEWIVALIPLGASMWAAHFGYHLLSSSIAPVVTRFLQVSAIHSMSLPEWWPSLKVLLLDTGLLVTFYLQWRAAGREWRRMIPGASGAAALYAAGLWILSQPMQMRGMMM